MATDVKKLSYPKNERVWVGYYNAKQELRFIITSKRDNRDWYFLYELKDGKFVKLAKSKNPLELSEKYVDGNL